MNTRGKPFDPTRNWPDLGPRFAQEIRKAAGYWSSPRIPDQHLSWSAILKRTFESYIRGDRPNMYGEWLEW